MPDRQFLKDSLCPLLNEEGQTQQTQMAELKGNHDDSVTVTFPLQTCLPDIPQGLVICLTDKQFLKDSFCVSLHGQKPTE